MSDEPTGYDHPYWKANPAKAEGILVDALVAAVEGQLARMNLDPALLEPFEDDLRGVLETFAEAVAEEEMDE